MVTLLLPGEPFPPADSADPSGLVAAGGTLDVSRLLAAYRAGLFPWPLLGADAPLLWFSPDPRCVLFPEELRVSRSLRRTLRRERLVATVDRCFDDVIEACRTTPRAGQDGTWITGEVVRAYGELRLLGIAHSVEVWDRGGELVGGLYGLAQGRIFFGESMFSLRPDASKVALVHLVERLRTAGFELIDCQQRTGHMESLGARVIPRTEFLRRLGAAVDRAPEHDPFVPGAPAGTEDG